MRFPTYLLFLSVPSLLLASPLAAEGLKSCDDFCMCNPGPACFLPGDAIPTPKVSLLDQDPAKAQNLGATPQVIQDFDLELKNTPKTDPSAASPDSTGNGKDIGDIGPVLSRAVSHNSPDTSGIAKGLIKAAEPAGSYTNSPKSSTNWSKFYNSKPTDFADLSLAKSLSKGAVHGDDESIASKADIFSGRSAAQKQKKADFSKKGESMTPNR